MLTKEQKLAILSEAIDNGARIDVSFHHMSQELAKALITDMAKKMNVELEAKEKWYTARTNRFKDELKLSAYFEPEYMVEDVNFEEEVEA